jgi:glucose/arabinose dehydrogenase
MMTTSLRSLAALVLCASPALALPDEIKTRDYTLKLEVVAENLQTPWGIAFVDADTLIVTEKPGRVRVIDQGRLSEPITGIPPVLDMGQGGLMAVSVDPDHANNGWVYLGYTQGVGDATTRGSNGLTRVVRGRIVDGAWTDQQVLWQADDRFYTRSGVHFGTRIVFDKEGVLYFSIGDRGAMQQAQDLTRPNGKIHRINRDGTIPADNPFAGRSDAYPSIFSYGNRNPQGLAFHPLTDELYATEHGPRGGDELNLIRAGINYGWPVISYGINYDGSKFTDLTEKEGLEQPVRQWTPSIAACGLDFVTGPMFPSWENQLLAGALAFQEVRRLKVEGTKVLEEEVIVKGLGRVRDVKVAPDGSIYLALNSPDVVVRLTRE